MRPRRGGSGELREGHGGKSDRLARASSKGRRKGTSRMGIEERLANLPSPVLQALLAAVFTWFFETPLGTRIIFYGSKGSGRRRR